LFAAYIVCCILNLSSRLFETNADATWATFNSPITILTSMSKSTGRVGRSGHPDTLAGETPEVPIYEKSRGPGSTAEVDSWTSKEPKQVLHSHLNYVVPDTKKWEQAAAYYLDTDAAVDAAVNAVGSEAYRLTHSMQRSSEELMYIRRIALFGLPN
jgi:hypothetical protein